MDENGTGKPSKMNPTELRLGNLLWYDLGKDPKSHRAVKVIEINAKEVVVSDGDLKIGLFDSQLKGVNLTPEWLERLGFELDHMGKRPYRIAIPEVCTLSATQNGFSDTGAWWLSMKSEYYSQPVTIIAHYVHELQNLYRVIAGKELELKTTE